MISKSAISLLFVFCLVSLSQSAPLVESGISLPDGYQSRAAWCQNVLGIKGLKSRLTLDKENNNLEYSFFFSFKKVCVDAMIKGTELRVIFQVAGATVFDKTMDRKLSFFHLKLLIKY